MPRPGVLLSRIRVAFASLLIGILWAGLAGAQTPNFSGRWEPVGSPDAPDSNLTLITHTTDRLSIRDSCVSIRGGHYGGPRMLSVYKMDGSENRSTRMDVESVATATMKDGRLTIVTVSKYPDGRIYDTTEVWSLDSAGDLVIETWDGLRGVAPNSRKQVYRKRI